VDRRFLSPEWHRVAHLRLRLRSHARIFRTHFRGQLWYVLQDRTSGRFHRFTPASHVLIALLDGERTLEEAWAIVVEMLPDEAVTQDDVLRILAQLHAADVLLGDLPPDIDEMVGRGDRTRRRRLVTSVVNPLAIRIPLFDPDGLLTVLMPLVRPLISWAGAILWLGVVGYGAALAAIHWGELTDNVADRVLSAQNLLLLVLAYPLVKAVHEFGHAFAVKRWGGEVHEMGVMFLVLMPVPYVDASGSLAFQDRWRRAFVAGAGILVEVLLAAVAMIVWAGAEPGLVRAFAFNVMLIGGISTVFFNGNPLLRFDGYYVLSDLLEIPNLAQRANAYVGYLIQRRVLGIAEAENPATAPGEALWFVPYAIAAFVYRVAIFILIALLVSTKVFFLGVVLAVWSVAIVFLLPLFRHVRFLLTSPKLRRRRGRALARVGGAVAAALVVLLFLPLPHATVVEGVVSVPGEGRVIASADGTVAALVAAPGEAVAAGDILVRLEDPLQEARVRLLEATVAERRRRLEEALATDQARARMRRAELEHAEADLALAGERREALAVRAGAAGIFVAHVPTDLLGRFVRQGELLGYVTTFRDPVVHALVPEADADLIRQGTRDLSLRFATNVATVLPARVVREVPELTDALPSLALAAEGGGAIALDPTAAVEARRALRSFLALEIGVDAGQPFRSVGERVFVRFRHDPAPVALRVWRSARQVFLDTFEI
jgi:putative peptide zinc metalloprotease protein